MWEKFDNGKTIGTKGSENGRVVLDEEHSEGARITLERKGDIAPWFITCGIYGGFLHTAFASDEAEGFSKYQSMKVDLVLIMNEQDDERRYGMMDHFSNQY